MNLPSLLRNFLAFALLACSSTTCLATDLSGTWSGTWNSNRTRHKGPLTAQFVKQDANHYAVHFTGRFFKIFPFQYSVVLEVIEDGDMVKLAGSHFLGKMFGTFCYSATADDCHFTASYTSKKDYGCFRLTRCARGVVRKQLLRMTARAILSSKSPPAGGGPNSR